MTRARELANFADDTAGLETLTISDITDLSVSASNINSATNQIIDSSTDLNVDSNTLVVDKSANKVGIGTTTPQALVVSKEASNIVEAINFVAEAYGDSGDTCGYYFSSHAGVATPRRKAGILLKKTGDYGLGDLHFVVDSNADDASISQASDTKMTIGSSGKVGIGTTSPDTATGFDSPCFEVAGTEPSIVLSKTGADSIAIVNHSSTLKFINDTDDRAFFHLHQDAPANSFVLDSSGLVGLGIDPAPYAYNDLVINQKATEGGITIIAGTSGTSAIAFGDGSSGNDRYEGRILYYHNGDQMVLATAGDGQVYIDSSGKVGIGASTPTYALDVEDSIAGGYVASLVNTHTGSGGGLLIQSANTSPGGQELLRIENQGNSKFEVHANGKVGIGTATPPDNLNVIGTLRVNQSTTLGHATNAGTAFEIRGDAISSGSTDVDYFKAFKIALNDGTEWGGQAQFSLGRYQESSSSAKSSLVISLGDGANNSSMDANVDVMTLRADGFVGIGTTSPGSKFHVTHANNGLGALFDGGNSGTPQYSGGTSTGKGEIQIGATSGYHGTISYSDSGSTEMYIHNNYTHTEARVTIRAGSSGGVHVKSGATSWSSSSDERMKNIHSNITGGLEKISKVRTVIASFKKSPEKVEPMLIAQDFIDILPEAVSQDPPTEHEDDGTPEDGAWTLSYTATIPLLVNAIQELSTKVTALESA